MRSARVALAASAGTIPCGFPGIRRARWWSRSEAVPAHRGAGLDPRTRRLALGQPWPAPPRLQRAYARHRRAVPVAVAVLPRAVPDRAQNFRLADADGDAALPAARHLGQRNGHATERQLRELRFPVGRRALPERLSQLRGDRGHLDDPLPADRLSDGLRHRARLTV